METLKTAIVVVLLLAVLFGVYQVLNNPDPFAQEQSVSWNGDASTPELNIESGPVFAGPSGPTAPGGIAGNTTNSVQGNSLTAAPTNPARDEVKSLLNDLASATEPPAANGSAPGMPITPGIPVTPGPSVANQAGAPTVDNSMTTQIPNNSFAAPKMPNEATNQLNNPFSAGPPPNFSTPNEFSKTAPSSLDGQVNPPNSIARADGPQDAPGPTVNPALQDNSSTQFLPSNSVYAKGPPTNLSGGQRATAEDDRPLSVVNSALSAAKSQIANNQFGTALTTLSLSYSDPKLTDADRSQLLQYLDPLAGKVIYSNEHLLQAPHVVMRGETLEDVARQYRVPVSLLQNINGVRNPLALVPGSKLKVVRGPFRAEVNVTRSEMTLFLGHDYAGRFPISVGQQPSPNPGTYTVQNKEPGRAFFSRQGGMVPAGHPKNPYGSAVLDLGNQVCIHGSAQVGSGDTQGCISLSPRDARDVYGILSAGSNVVVRR